MKYFFILISMFIAATSSAETTSYEKPKIGIGKFQQNQILAINFLFNVGWDESTEYEETGLIMKDLLIKMISSDKESKEWVENVNNYFRSEEFKNKDSKEQKSEIFEAKLYAKMMLKELGLVP